MNMDLAFHIAKSESGAAHEIALLVICSFTIYQCFNTELKAKKG